MFKRNGLGTRRGPIADVGRFDGLNRNAQREPAPALSRYFARQRAARWPHNGSQALRINDGDTSRPDTNRPGIYSLDVAEVRRVLDAKLRGRPYDEAQFLVYHLHRNVFNVKSEVTTLTRQGGGYVDNLGNVWEEVSSLKNYYHMPLGNWVGSVLGVTTPFSRKFLRDDTTSGLGGEFEMIIRQDGRRIDATADGALQETYNYGRTRDFTPHKRLDVDPHNANGNYTFRQNMGRVRIIE